jgi:DNA-binding NtrC family response regulator
VTAGRLSRAAACGLRETTVLLVAVEGLVKDLLFFLIQEKCGDVQDTSSAAKGLELFGKREFDLVVVDERLPDLNRAGFLTDIRKGNPKAAVALIGSRNDGAASDPAVIRADALIGFPLDMDRLASMFYKAVHARKGIE